MGSISRLARRQASGGLGRTAVVRFGGGFWVELAQAADDFSGAGAADGFGFSPAADGERSALGARGPTIGCHGGRISADSWLREWHANVNV